MRDFRELKVWQKAHRLTLAIYKATRDFPREELYGLTSQIRRGSVSVAANIAEGCGRDGARDFARFLQIAMGSASELEYLLVLTRDLELLDAAVCERFREDTVEVKRMLASFIQKLTAES
jgi:four helix bundle protein